MTLRQPAQASNGLMSKIIVVGAGLAGLSAGVRLADAGFEVEVLEARDEIGGRTRSRVVDGTVIELGGQFLSRPHRRMRELVADTGLHLQRTRLWAGTTRLRCHGAVRLTSVLSLSDLRALSRIAFGPNSLHTIRDARDIRANDARSVQQWLDGIGLDGPLRPLADTLIGQTLGGTDPGEVSLLAFAELISSEGNGLLFLLDGFGLTDYIVEGVRTLCTRLAQRLPTIRLQTPVVSVEHDADRVAVRIHGGGVVEGDHLVLTIPGPVLDSVDFRPQLPESIRTANGGLRFGQAIKVAAVVKRRGVLPPTGFVGGSVVRQGWRAGDVLYGLAGGADAIGSDVSLLIADLCAGFGINPREVMHAETLDWTHDPFTRGTYGHFLPGRFDGFRQSLPQCDGRIHLAGAERSAKPGFMEGAVESGEGAADLIIASAGS